MSMRNRLIGVSVLVLAATAMPVAPAQAQEIIQPKADIRVGVGVVHESNVARSDAARALARGLERADTRISPSIQLDIVRPMGNGSASLSGEIGYDFHFRNPELDRERIGLLAGVAQRVAMCDVDLAAEVSRRQSDLGDIAFLGLNPALQSVRNAETRQRYGADLACGNSIGIRPSVGIEYVQGRNSNPIRDRAEYDSIRYTAGLQYVQPSIGEIMLYGSQRDVDLVRQPLLGDVDGYRARDIGLRLKRDIGARWQGQVMAGFSWVNPRNPVVGSTSGLIWNIGLSGQVGPRLRLALQTGREFSNSLSSDSNYQLTRPSSLQATYAVNDRLQLTAGIRNSRNTFSYIGVVPGLAITRENRWVYSGGINYQVNRRIRLGINGGYERRNANGTFFDYGNSFIGGSLAFVF